MSADRQDSVSSTPDEPVKCAKCGHRNAREAEVCLRCGKHLYVACRACGHRIARAERICPHCGERFHRPFWRKLTKKGKLGLSVVDVALIILLILAISALILAAIEFFPTGGRKKLPELSY